MLAFLLVGVAGEYTHEKEIMMTALVGIVGIIVFVLLLRTATFIRLTFFCRGVVILLIVSVGIALILQSLVSAIIWFCIMLVFFTHVPVTADRSVSIFLLGYMNRMGSSTYSKKQLHDALISIYIDKNNALDKRITEQLESGTIVRAGNGYTMTKRGVWLMHLYITIADIFGIEKKNVVQ